ncbi:uncharacterized protein LOC129957434 isoform X1 [Argiope bruennichi]|uniref:uncharacterized protein LOC129957434 isoform X1 n=1 Tax=Argiope bruennichi TaxID=94029 RepID=UPI0024954BBE|nr:uncharacterized protein LOC129957434 isoform X1 [Argiope bruennichi]
MEQAFIHRNTPAVRRPPERHQNDQMAAAALLQDIDNGTGAVHWYSAQRRMEEGRIGSEEHRVRPKCSVRCVVEMAVWLPVMMIQTSSVLMGSNYYNQCPRLQILPLILIIMGVIGIVFMIYVLFNFGEENSYGLKGKARKRIKAFCITCMIFWIPETVQYFIPVSFDPASAEYCNVVLYAYGIFWNAFTIFLAATGILLLIFIPERPVYLPTPRDTLEFQQRVGMLRNNNNYINDTHL